MRIDDPNSDTVYKIACAGFMKLGETICTEKEGRNPSFSENNGQGPICPLRRTINTQFYVSSGVKLTLSRPA